MSILRFFSGSRPVPAGEGVGEVVAEADREMFKKLPDRFRERLSNFYEEKFTFNFVMDFDVLFNPLLEGTEFGSIEAAFQAGKFLLAASMCQDPVRHQLLMDAVNKFTLNSGHPIGQGGGLMARKNRKLVALAKPEIHAWRAVSDEVMEAISEAAFTQCDGRKEVLLNTGNAILEHIRPRMTPVRFHHLESIRARLRGSKRARLA